MACCSSVTLRLCVCCSSSPRVGGSSSFQSSSRNGLHLLLVGSCSRQSHPSQQECILDTVNVEFASDEQHSSFLAVVLHSDGIAELPRQPCVSGRPNAFLCSCSNQLTLIYRKPTLVSMSFSQVCHSVPFCLDDFLPCASCTLVLCVLPTKPPSLHCSLELFLFWIIHRYPDGSKYSHHLPQLHFFTP